MLNRILEPEVMDAPGEAEDYDSMDHSEVNDRFVSDLLDVAPNPGKTLDIGVGTALIPIALCKREPNCQVVGIDLAESMLELGRKNVQADGLSGRIQLLQIDAKRSSFEPHSFDSVISNSIIHHVPNPESVFEDAVRVVRRGGHLFIRDLARPDSLSELNRLVELHTQGANERQRALFAASLHAALTVEEIAIMVTSHGFDRSKVKMTSDRHWTFSAIRA